MLTFITTIDYPLRQDEEKQELKRSSFVSLRLSAQTVHLNVQCGKELVEIDEHQMKSTSEEQLA